VSGFILCCQNLRVLWKGVRVARTVRGRGVLSIAALLYIWDPNPAAPAVALQFPHAHSRGLSRAVFDFTCLPGRC